MRSSLRLPVLDLKKVSDAVARQLRHHDVLDAFIEICGEGLDAYGLDVQEMASVPPRPLLWASNGAQPLVRLLPDEHPVHSMWAKGLRREFTRYMERGDRRVIGMLRSRLYDGPYIKSMPPGSENPHLIAACVAMLHGEASSIIVHEDSVVATGINGRNNSIEVFPDFIRYGDMQLNVPGRIPWEMVNIGMADRPAPKALLDICRDILFVKDEMLDTLLVAFYRALNPKVHTKAQIRGVLGSTLLRMVPLLRESGSTFAVSDAPMGSDLTQPVFPRRPYRKVYDTKAMAGSVAIPDILSGVTKHGAVAYLSVPVNLLEIFNFYVVDHAVISPEGFWEMTKRAPVVQDKPNVVPIRTCTLRRWSSILHDS